MSIAVLLIAGVPALLVFSVAMMTDSRASLYWATAIAIAVGLFTGSPVFFAVDLFFALVAMAAGHGLQTQRLERNADWRAGKGRPLPGGGTTISDDPMPKPVWHDTPEAEKNKLQSEHAAWLARRQKKE